MNRRETGTSVFGRLFPWELAFSHKSPASLLPIALAILYFELLLSHDIFMLATDNSNEIYFIFFGLIIIFEFFILARIGLLVFKKKYIFPLFGAIAILTGVFVSMAYFNKSLDTLNFLDFVLLVVKFLISVLIILKIILKGKVHEYPGIVLFIATFTSAFILQMFVSGLLAYGYLTNWPMGQISMIFTESLWLGVSLVWRKKL
jgi:hypothetical protein